MKLHSLLFKLVVLALNTSLSSPLLSQAGFTNEEFNKIWNASPLGKYSNGKRLFGIFDLQNPILCDLSAVENFYSHQDEPLSVRFYQNSDFYQDKKDPRVLKPLYPIGPAAQSFRNDVLKFHRTLLDAGDEIVAGRYLCMGMAEFDQVNAHSIPLGFLVFDPQIFQDINHNPDRTIYSFDAVTAHEYAHQLQTWHQDPALKDKNSQGKPYSRRKELQADCVAGALITLLQVKESLESPIWQSSKSGIAASVRALGDFAFDLSDHHGTPEERENAAKLGIRLAETHVMKYGSAKDMRSKTLLDRCRPLSNP